MNNSNYLTGVVATFNGSGSSATVTLGTPTVLDSSGTYAHGTSNQNLAYDTTAQKIVVSYCHASSNAITIVLTLSGTSLTAGSRITVPIYGTYINDGSVKVAYSSTENRVIYLYADNNNYKYYTTVGTVSGNSISFGSTQELSNQAANSTYSNNGGNACIAVANTGEIVLTYLNSSFNIFSHAGTLSNTTMTWGSPSQISNIICYSGTAGGGDDQSGQEPIASGKIIIARSTKGSSPSHADKGVFCVISVSGTSVTNGTVQVFNDDTTGGGGNYDYRYAGVTTNVSKTQAVFGSGNGKIDNIVYLESSQQTTPVSNLTSDNYFGIAAETKSNGQDVKVTRPGSLNKNQTGMTAGKDMYVTDAGLIKERTTTTVTTNSDISSSSGYEIADVNNYERDISVAYDTTNDKIGVLYANSNHYPTIAIGSESNNAITWGTPVVVNSASSSPTNHSGQKLAYGNGIFVASYFLDSNDTNYIKAGSYSGTNSITLGSAIQPNTGTSHFTGGTIAYNPNANKFVYTFAENSSTSIIAYLITNSGTTLTTGNSATITMGYTGNNKVIWNEYDPDTNKQVIMTDHLYGDEGRIYQATISGANITVPSTHYAITDEGTEQDGSKALSYDPDNDKWILFKAQAGNVLRANVLTASGDTFTSGTATQISSQYMRWLAPYYDTEQNKTVLVYMKNTSGYYGEIGFVTISGTTPSFTASATTLGNQTAERVLHNASLYNPDTKSGIVVSATPLSNTKATGFVLHYGTTSSTVVNGSQSNFVGVARSGTDLELVEPPTELVGMANGSITKGKPVILRTDGDFAEVGGTSSSGGTVSPETQQISSQQNTEDKFYIADNGNGIFAVVSIASNRARIILGEDTGTSITWGSEVTLDDTSENITGVSVYYDSEEDKFIATNVSGGSQNVCSYIVSYSGTTATKGTQSSLLALGFPTSNYVLASDYNTTDKKGIVCVGKDTGKLFTVTVSGTTITQSALSSQFSGSSNSAQFFQMVYDNTNSVGYITYRNEAISDYPYIQTFTVSGDTFSFGTETVIESLSADGYVGVAEGSADGKGVCVAWRRSGDGIKYIAPTFSGLVPTIGGVTTLSGGQVPDTSLYWEGAQVVNYNPVSQSFILAYQDTSGKYDIITNNGTVSGSTLTFSDYDVVYPQTNASQYYAISNPTGKNANNVFIIQQRYNQSPRKTAGSIWGASYNTTSTNLTSTNFIGFAQNTVADNEDVKVKVISQSDFNQTGLTTASQYYVQNDGTLSTTAGTPSVLGGTALSSTSLLIKS